MMLLSPENDSRLAGPVYRGREFMGVLFCNIKLQSRPGTQFIQSGYCILILVFLLFLGQISPKDVVSGSENFEG